ncbi:MAG: hypothetical protein HY540_02335 [Deltaproteobacteria bacterium]|nr:hypothetical protein [Deltaproteobacteria bacterium]
MNAVQMTPFGVAVPHVVSQSPTVIHVAPMGENIVGFHCFVSRAAGNLLREMRDKGHALRPNSPYMINDNATLPIDVFAGVRSRSSRDVVWRNTELNREALGSAAHLHFEGFSERGRSYEIDLNTCFDTCFDDQKPFDSGSFVAARLMWKSAMLMVEMTTHHSVNPRSRMKTGLRVSFNDGKFPAEEKERFISSVAGRRLSVVRDKEWDSVQVTGVVAKHRMLSELQQHDAELPYVPVGLELVRVLEGLEDKDESD